jgi:multicomponent Na+:H+ antiporter subunit D
VGGKGLTSNLPVTLFIIPFTAALLAAALGWVIPGIARWISLVALLATAVLAVTGIPAVLEAGSLHTHLAGWAPPFGIEVVLDPLSAFVAALVAVVAFVVVAGSESHVDAELPGRRTVYHACVLLLLSGLMGMVITNDLFNLFVQLEVASLSAYALVASGGRGAPKAGLTYLMVGTFGASLYLMGVAFLYAATGSLNMSDVASLIPGADQRLVFTGGMLMIAGLGIKAAIFPLHTWMPGAYALSPAPAASLMAPLVTKVSAYALIRIIFWVFGAGTVASMPPLLELLAWGGALAMVVGGILALLQDDFRRLLAYSSVGQMGVIAVGIGIANQNSLTGAVLHIANDALMKAVLFMAAGVALIRFGVRRVNDLHRFRGRAPWTAAAMTIAALSLVGVPPLSGFFGKWYVLSGAISERRWILAAALVVGSLATVGYVFRILEQLYFVRERPASKPAADPTPPVTDAGQPAGPAMVIAGGAGRDPGGPAGAGAGRDAGGPAGAGAGRGGTTLTAPARAEREGSVGVVAACAVLAAGIVILGLANARVVSLVILPSLPGAAP